MAKITLSSILGSFASVLKLNSLFDDVESEFNNKVLYRDNPQGEDNSMQNDLDMNGQDILNANEVWATLFKQNGTELEFFDHRNDYDPTGDWNFLGEVKKNGFDLIDSDVSKDWAKDIQAGSPNVTVNYLGNGLYSIDASSVGGGDAYQGGNNNFSGTNTFSGPVNFTNTVKKNGSDLIDASVSQNWAKTLVATSTNITVANDGNGNYTINASDLAEKSGDNTFSGTNTFSGVVNFTQPLNSDTTDRLTSLAFPAEDAVSPPNATSPSISSVAVTGGKKYLIEVRGHIVDATWDAVGDTSPKIILRANTGESLTATGGSWGIYTALSAPTSALYGFVSFTLPLGGETIFNSLANAYIAGNGGTESVPLEFVYRGIIDVPAAAVSVAWEYLNVDTVGPETSQFHIDGGTLLPV